METVFAELFKVANNNRDSPNKFRDATANLFGIASFQVCASSYNG